MPETPDSQRIKEIVNKLPRDDIETLFAYILKSTEEVTERLISKELEQKMASHLRGSVAGAFLDEGFTEAVAQTLDHLACRTRDSKEDILLKAWSLYEEAIRVFEQGERLAVLGKDYSFIREIVGFEHTDRKPATTEFVSGSR